MGIAVLEYGATGDMEDCFIVVDYSRSKQQSGLGCGAVKFLNAVGPLSLSTYILKKL